MDAQVPNGVGSALGAIQLILYAVYKDWKKKSIDEKAATGHMNAMEMGYYGQTKADNLPHEKYVNGFECQEITKQNYSTES